MQEELETRSWKNSQIGPYRIEKKLGAGGMGAVYRAWDERLGRSVALKQILPKAIESDRARRRFRREARSAARLNHPGVVRVHDLLHHEGCDWIVMELVQGETLSQLLATGALSTDRSLMLSVQVADALAAAHAEGIVHRDLKASNILVMPETQGGSGRVKILDFGLAKQVIQGDRESTSISLEGHLIGTPHAMSPEQAMGRKVDLRSDLFSFGSLLYEMLTGVAPFRADNPLESMTRVCTHHPPSPREHMPALSPVFSDLVDRLLEKDPGHRPRSAAEVAQALRRIGDSPGAGTSTKTETTLAEDADDATIAASTVSTGSSSSSPRTERRQVTVLCCELVGSDGSTGSLDPEVLYGASAELESLVRAVAERFEGHLANVLGHRLVVSFGYPQAHEDDVRRAVDAALELATASRDLGTSAASTPELALRVGIHTGPAVVHGDAMQREQLILGRTLDLAAGLQKHSVPGHVLVSDATRQLIAGTHGAQACDPVELDGFAEPVEVFRVLEASDTSTWEITGRLTPLIARQEELGILRERWRLACEGQGQVVLLAGEAGIGKSRLLHALKEELVDGGATWLIAQGSSYMRGSPLYPITQLLRRLFRLDKDDSIELQLDRLEEELARYDLGADAVLLFATLLTLPFEGRYPPLSLRPQKQREKTLEALVAFFDEMTRHEHVALVIEDLHWIDPSTLEFLGRLIDRMEKSSLFLLLSFRPEFGAAWGDRSHLTRLNLSRLAGSQVSALIDRVSGGRGLPAAIRDQIVTKTDGVPLFVEELTKSILESDLITERDGRYEIVGSLDDLTVPATLRDSLTARLDRLGTAKEVAQLAATIGREFSYRLLATVSTLQGSILDRALDSLVEAELVHRKGFSSNQRYLFKHALIQDAAYESLLKGQRQRYHGEIAGILEDTFPKFVKTEPELLAHHFTEARKFERAVEYWHRAGDLTFQRSALVEATDHIHRGLYLIEYIQNDNTRKLWEMRLEAARGTTLGTVKGFADTDVGSAYSHALELCQETENSPELFWILWGLWRFKSVRADHEGALEIAHRLVHLAEPQPDPALKIAAYCWRGSTLFCKGEFTAALKSFEQAISFDSLNRKKIHASQMGHDPGVNSRCVACRCLWFLGYSEQADQRIEETIDLAKRLSHPFSLTNCYHCATALSYNRRDRARVLEQAEKVIAMSREQGSFWDALTQIYIDWASTDDLEDVGKVGRIRRQIDKQLASGAKYFRPVFLAMLAEAAAEQGDYEDGILYLDEALEVIEETGETFYHAEVCRLYGEMEIMAEKETPREGDRQRAEDWFQLALEISRHQRAKALELRATVSLSRLLARNGQVDEAIDLLTEIYNWFTEGFDTWDLKEAGTWLVELSLRNQKTLWQTTETRVAR